MEESLLPVVRDIMIQFAANTGLDLSLPSSLPRRYLWTDAFAVSTLLQLSKSSGETKYKELAITLIQQVHNTLGKHRPDDKEGRTGWISGLTEAEGRLHPTMRGLRIGKKLPERLASEAYDDEDEWDQDGQYFHYLTKWMQALCQAAYATSDTSFATLGAELAKGVHEKFVYSRGSVKRMYWKMSIDISRPLVPSMGHHDPLDGYITYYYIQECFHGDRKLSLDKEMRDLYSIVEGQELSTSDPLGLGGLLCDVYRVFQLHLKTDDPLLLKLLEKITHETLSGLHSYNPKRLETPAKYRLAFREFGLSIGLQAVKKMKDSIAKANIESKYSCIVPDIDQILQYAKLVNTIHKFWGEESNRKVSSWKEHLDINMVMWATSLLPDGFIELKLS